MPRKTTKTKKGDNTPFTITIHVNPTDGPTTGDKYMVVETTSEMFNTEGEEKKKKLLLATELVVAAGIQIGEIVDDQLELAKSASLMMTTLLKSSMLRMNERGVLENTGTEEEGEGEDTALAKKLGLSNSELAEMKNLLKTGM